VTNSNFAVEKISKRLVTFTISNPAFRQVGSHTFELVEPYTVVYKVDDKPWLEFTVPAGFVTDFASVPWFIWWLIPMQGDYNRAAVLHDFLYTKKTCSRFLADALFRDVMREIGVPLWKRVVMYYGVRMFGWINWRK
jgi:hypothetical protein